MNERFWKVNLVTHQGANFPVVVSKGYAQSFLEEYEELLAENTVRINGFTDTGDRASLSVLVKKEDILGVSAFEI